MVNLFDIMRQAQSGAAMANLSRQFGLSPDQTQRAVEALLPAFTMAFQRSSASPNAFAQLLDLMGSNRFAPFFDRGIGAAFGPAQANGQQVLDQLFGADLSRQIAAQSAAATGVATQVMQQMMPVMAAMLMGGLFKLASAEGLSDFLRAWSEWLRSLAPAPTPAPPAGAGAFSSPFAMWTEMADAMGAGQAAPAGAAPSPTDQWATLMGGMFGATPTRSPPSPPPAAANPFETLARMFDTGREAQAQHLAGLQKMFDAFWTPPGSR